MALCALPGCTRPAHRPVSLDGDPVVHKYCGRTHAEEVLQGSLQEPHGSCHVCKLGGCSKSVQFDRQTGRVHDFCCKAHAQEAVHEGTWPRSRRNESTASIHDQCSFPECTAPRCTDPASHHRHDFCGRSHAVKAKEKGLGFSFKRGDDNGEVWGVTALRTDHPKFDSVKKQFLLGWLHEGEKPVVDRILQVRNTPTAYAKYQSYKKRQTDLGHASEVRRFHGTSLAHGCSFGVDFASGPCGQSECAVCNICCKGFLVASGLANGANTLRLRYGSGTYFSKTSSKSNDYAAGSERGVAGRRIMFLCKVAPGKMFKATQPMMSPDELDEEVHSKQYTSVSADSKQNGGPLNYDELIVFDDAAAIPSYIIVYSTSTAQPVSTVSAAGVVVVLLVICFAWWVQQ